MKKKKFTFKVVASALCLCFYLFMATGSDESSGSSWDSSSDSPTQEEPVYTPSAPVEKEPVFSNDEVEEEKDDVLMNDTW